jgi:hypothetical protein
MIRNGLVPRLGGEESGFRIAERILDSRLELACTKRRLRRRDPLEMLECFRRVAVAPGKQRVEERQLPRKPFDETSNLVQPARTLQKQAELERSLSVRRIAFQ